MKQPSLLSFERKDWQERYGDDEQREEQRWADLACRLDQDLGAGFVGRRTLQVLVRVLDHDDGRVDHSADGDGDAAQAHDVRREPQRVHEDVGDEDAERQRQDRNEGAAEVQ